MNDRVISLAISGLWAAWLLIWFVFAGRVKETTWREPLTSQLRHRIPLMLAAYLVLAPAPPPAVMTIRFLPHAFGIELFGVVLVAAGLSFAVRARRYLGTNWSAVVTVKKDHALIRTGPYALVRHPIYTGMLLAFLGTAVAIGQWRGLAALGLAVIALLIKSRIEESQMSRVFPEYAEYRRHTAALIPFVL